MPCSNSIVEKKSKLSSFQKEQLKDGYITTHKTKLTLVQKEMVKQKVQSIHSDIPIVVAVMRKSSVESRFFLVSSIFLMFFFFNHVSFCLNCCIWNINVNAILHAVNSELTLNLCTVCFLLYKFGKQFTSVLLRTSEVVRAFARLDINSFG